MTNDGPIDPAVAAAVEARDTASARARAVESGEAKTVPFDLGPSSKGASGREGLDSLKKNPYRGYRLRTSPSLWFGGVQDEVLRFALFILNGYSWEQENADRFVAVHAEIHEVRRIRDAIARLISEDYNKHFWPAEDEEKQLVLIDFVRLLPRMWD